jgi:hypothetical protein
MSKADSMVGYSGAMPYVHRGTPSMLVFIFSVAKFVAQATRWISVTTLREVVP